MNDDVPTGPQQPDAAAARREQARRWRRAGIIYLILLAGYVLSFVHRTAPAAISAELTRAFQISSALLGTLAATYFYVYTVLQIPVGVLADTLGPRWLVTIGAFVAGAGSLLFGLAPAWEIAAIGRTLVGIGVAVTFVSLLKICANWFAPERFATLIGVTMLAGNLGAVAAGAPLAWAVSVMSWRTVFVALGLASVAIGALTWILVRDRPEECGFQPIAGRPAAQAETHWTHALRQVLARPATWPAVCVNIGVGGSYLAFAGLWVVPYLRQVHGVSPTVAAEHASLLLLGVAVGSLVVGLVSDRLRNRRGVMIAYTFAYALSWLPWLLHVPMPLWASYTWCLVMGLLVPGFILTWTIAKEANRPEHAGMAVSVVNVGIFLGAGLLQPLVGAVLDAGRARGALAGAWDQAIGLLAASAALGALCALLVRASPAQRGEQA